MAALENVKLFIATDDEWEGEDSEFVASTGSRAETVRLVKSDLRELVAEIDRLSNESAQRGTALQRIHTAVGANPPAPLPYQIRQVRRILAETE